MSRITSDASDEIERLRAQSRQSEMRLAEVQRSAQVGYWERNLAKHCAWWSDEFRRILGVPSNEAAPGLQVAVELFVHPDDRQMVRQAFQNTIGNGVPFDNEHRIVRRDGTERVVHARGEAIVGADGAVTGLMGTMQDITERKRLERALIESEARCRSIFEHVPLGIVMAGADRRFSMVNPAWVRMTGYSAEELAQIAILDITHPDDRAESESIMARARAGDLNEFVLDKRYVRKSGEVFWGRTVGTVLRDERGAITHRVAMIEDITEKKDAELRRVEQQRQQREALVREVNHRIKNSLQGVAGLLEQHGVANPALGPAIEDAIMRLNALAMVHGLYSELGGRKLNLCNIARSIVEILRAVSPAPLEFVLTGGFLPVEVNDNEVVPIALILNELVSNAVKHLDLTAARAAVKVEVMRDGAGAVIVVRSEPARLPPGFDLSTDRFLGSGLKLAKSLLPSEGARLTVNQSAAGVVESVLALWPPVLKLAVNAASEA